MEINAKMFATLNKTMPYTYTPMNISRVNLSLLNQFFLFFILRNSMPRTIKLNRWLFRSTAKCNSSFQSEPVHASAFSNQTNHFRILVPLLKHIVSSSSITPKNLLAESR